MAVPPTLVVSRRWWRSRTDVELGHQRGLYLPRDWSVPFALIDFSFLMRSPCRYQLPSQALFVMLLMLLILYTTLSLVGHSLMTIFERDLITRSQIVGYSKYTWIAI